MDEFFCVFSANIVNFINQKPELNKTNEIKAKFYIYFLLHSKSIR